MNESVIVLGERGGEGLQHMRIVHSENEDLCGVSLLYSEIDKDESSK